MMVVNSLHGDLVRSLSLYIHITITILDVRVLCCLSVRRYSTVFLLFSPSNYLFRCLYFIFVSRTKQNKIAFRLVSSSTH